MGTPEFAVPSLDILVKNGYDVVAVVTAPDSMGGRGGKQLLESPVKKYAILHDIPVLQPIKLRDPLFIQKLSSLDADIQIVVAFRMLPEIVWNMPRLGTYNLHGSLLPKYRGAAPIHHAIIQGEKETGVTFFKLKHEIDTGDVLMYQKMDINENDDTGTVHDRMMDLAAETVLEAIKKIESGNYNLIQQTNQDATSAPKIFHHNCQIDFNQSCVKVYNFIRGHSPWPGAWTKWNDTEIKIVKSEYELSNDKTQIGSIITDHKHYIKIKCIDGYISITLLKPEGKKLLTVTEYLNGSKNIPSAITV